MRNAASPASGASTAPSEVVVMDVEPGAFWFGAWRNINLLVWWQGASRDGIERLERTNLARTQQHPEHISTVHIITAQSGVPTPEAKDALSAMNTRWGHTVGCAAIVIERGGLMGLAVRSAVTGLVMVAPKHYRIKVFDDVDTAAPWFVLHHARSTGVTLELPDLLAVLHSARSCGQ